MFPRLHRKCTPGSLKKLWEDFQEEHKEVQPTEQDGLQLENNKLPSFVYIMDQSINQSLKSFRDLLPATFNAQDELPKSGKRYEDSSLKGQRT